MKKTLLLLAILIWVIGAQSQSIRSLEKQNLDSSPKLSPAPNQQPIVIGSNMGSVTDKHPEAVYFVLIAAGLAAIASITSSVITASVAWKSKDKEYKNDYFKKVIDRRIKAIESAEAALNLFATDYISRETEQLYHCYFLDDLESKKLEVSVDEMAKFNIWFSRETKRAFVEFSSVIFPILDEAKKHNEGKEDSSDLISYAIDQHAKIDRYRKKVDYCIGIDMRNLYNVNDFFNSNFDLE